MKWKIYRFQYMRIMRWYPHILYWYYSDAAEAAIILFGPFSHGFMTHSHPSSQSNLRACCCRHGWPVIHYDCLYQISYEHSKLTIFYKYIMNIHRFYSATFSCHLHLFSTGTFFVFTLNRGCEVHEVLSSDEEKESGRENGPNKMAEKKWRRKINTFIKSACPVDLLRNI